MSRATCLFRAIKGSSDRQAGVVCLSSRAFNSLTRALKAIPRKQELTPSLHRPLHSPLWCHDKSNSAVTAKYQYDIHSRIPYTYVFILSLIRTKFSFKLRFCYVSQTFLLLMLKQMNIMQAKINHRPCTKH